MGIEHFLNLLVFGLQFLLKNTFELRELIEVVKKRLHKIAAYSAVYDSRISQNLINAFEMEFADMKTLTDKLIKSL